MDLGEIFPEWKGFFLTRDRLFTQYGHDFRPGELNLYYLQQQIIQSQRAICKEPQQYDLFRHAAPDRFSMVSEVVAIESEYKDKIKLLDLMCS